MSTDTRRRIDDERRDAATDRVKERYQEHAAECDVADFDTDVTHDQVRDEARWRIVYSVECDCGWSYTLWSMACIWNE